MKKHICVHFSWGKRLLVLLFVTIYVLSCSLPVSAKFAGDEAFSDISWELVMRDSLANSYGTIQAFCATDEYYIIIENSSQNETTPDVVSAYYRYDHDAEGNPVEQYALARRVEEFDYEHANGIAWNPHTDEVYVAPCLNNGKNSKGCIFVMDPHTLMHKETRKIYPGWLIRALDYDADAERYAVLVSKGSTWKLLLMDNDFNVLETQKAPDNSPGTYYQDICLTGDYLLTPPYTLSLGVGSYVNVHSISRASKLYSVPINVDLKKSEKIEGEAICETEPGIFMMAVNFFRNGQRELRLYRSTVPYYFSVSVSIANGYATLASEKVLRGSDYTIDYEPYEGFQLTSIEVDGTKIDHEAFEEAYTFKNVQENHTISINYTAAGVSYAAPAAPIPTGSVEEVLSERAQRVAAEEPALAFDVENEDIPAADSLAPDASYEMPSIVTALLTIGSTSERLIEGSGSALSGLGSGTVTLLRRAGENIRNLAVALVTSRLLRRMMLILAGAAAAFCLIYLPYVRIERNRRHMASLRKRRALKARIEEAEKELLETELSLSYLF